MNFRKISYNIRLPFYLLAVIFLFSIIVNPPLSAQPSQKEVKIPSSVNAPDASEKKKDDGTVLLAEVGELNLIIGELITIKANSLTRVSVTDPSIADIADTK